MKKLLYAGAALAVCVVGVRIALAHCEVPCGIYDDRMRVAMIAENITTIEKAMQNIRDLSTDEDKNYNQIVRWIVNKEEHAEKLQETVWQYFMTQRLKPVASEDDPARRAYVHQLTLLHEMLVYAMKSKQTTDLANVEKLRGLLDEFEDAYFGAGEEAGAHHEHHH